MNTKHITDRKERKKLKRAARKRRELAHPLAKRPADVPRGSMKRKVPKMAKGQRKR